jgi:phosphoenolpyruvate carboxylase
MDQPTDYPEGEGEGYAGIQHRLVDPIERAHGLSLRITTAIANHFGAHG